MEEYLQQRKKGREAYELHYALHIEEEIEHFRTLSFKRQIKVMKQRKAWLGGTDEILTKMEKAFDELHCFQ